MKTVYRQNSPEQGQAAVIIALALVGLVAMAALVFDGGAAFSQRRHMQNAADAGAIAGAVKLAQGASDSVINATVQEYTVARNRAQAFVATYVPGNQSVGDGSVPSDATGIQVLARTNFATFFAAWLGNPSGAVSASARASFGGVNNLRNAVTPIAPKCAVANPTDLGDCGFQFDQSYDIWDGGGVGNFGWLAWSNSNSNSADNSERTLRENLAEPDDMTYTNPYNSTDQTLSVSDWINGTPGVTGGTGVKEQLTTLVDNARPVTVILYGETQNSGSNLQYRVVGFAEFIVEGYKLANGAGNNYGDFSRCASGTGNCIQGRFVQYMISAPVDSTRNLGLISVHLTN